MSSGGYKYDEGGQSYFFVLSVLLVILVPLSYSTLRGGADRAAARVKYPCAGWNKKATEVNKAKGTSLGFSFRHVILLVGWVAFAAVVRQASLIEADAALFDPYKILGLSVGSSEKAIKKHYRKMSLKFHPDKIQLADNQTKADADNMYIELTKAYKALTDDEMRKNYEQYGHPDGKQDFSQGIALPAWVVDPANTGYVMGAYALLLGVMLPFFVGRWWYGTRKLTKDGILNSTATTFFHGLKEESTFGQMVDLLASADEYVVSKNVVRARRKVGKAGQDEYARLASVVREHQGEKAHGGWEGYNGWTTPRKRARVLITAHLLRVPINDAALLRESQATVTLALPLAGGMSSFALAHNWLACSIGILRLQQFIIQAVHPSSSPLLQLPHVNDEIVQAARQQGVYTVQQFGRLTAAQADKLLPGVRDDEKKEIVEVAKHWPVTDFIGANFQVIGEKTVTPGSIVSFVVKLKLNLPGRDQGTSVANGSIIDENSFVDTEDDDEQSIDELIGRRPASEEGLTPTPFAHAPHFPRNRKPTWHLFVGDHKLNRVFVQPTRFTDVGPDKTRTVRVTFPAPPGPGLYTFQVYLMSDAFVGTDAQKDMRMKVEAVEEEGAESDAESDSISEPDEDSLAGQMALMKGQGVKRSAVHGEESEEESGSEGESGTEESGSEEEEEESGSEVTTDDDDDEMVTTSDSDSD